MRSKLWFNWFAVAIAAALFTAPHEAAWGQFREVFSDDQSVETEPADLTITNVPFKSPQAPSAEPTGTEPTGEKKPQIAKAEPTPEPAAATRKQGEPTPALTTAAADQKEVGSQNDDPPVVSDEPTAPVQPANPFQSFSSSDDKVDAPEPDQLGAHGMQFNQIQPGSSVARLKETWGEPAQVTAADGVTTLIYQVPGFLQVDVLTDMDVSKVGSIVVHLSEPVAAAELTAQLRIADLRPLIIRDDTGKALGQAIPERGVLLGYAEPADAAADDQDPRIAAVSLEPVQGELFRMRAEQDRQHRYIQSLADLKKATILDSRDARAHWLQAELLSLTGRDAEALDSAKVAAELDGDSPLYRLTRARLAGHIGEWDDAVTETKSVLATPGLPKFVQARGEYQLGNLLATGTEPDFQQAISHHLKSIDAAATHLKDERDEVRRMAKDILVDAHLAIAQDIAMGNFQKQRDVVPKWLVRATELAEQFITEDSGDPTIRMHIYRTTLSTYSVLDGNFDASVATDEAIREGRRLVAASQDALYQQRVERDLIETLYYASKVEHRRGRGETAMQYANNAVALLQNRDTDYDELPFDQYLQGQLYYLLGSLYAINREDHDEAVRWYDKAEAILSDDAMDSVVDTSTFGELFVSMGVSYWEAGEHEKAVALTQTGAERMQDAVAEGKLDLESMSVPYGNLATMHRSLGNTDRAEHFTEMVAKIEKEGSRRR